MTRRLTLLALLAAGCMVEGERAPLTPGSGIKLDNAAGTVALDPALVPMPPACAPGQFVRRTADGWECADVGSAFEIGDGLVRDTKLAVDFGAGEKQVARGNHDHDSRYRTREEAIPWSALQQSSIPDYLRRSEYAPYTDADAQEAVTWATVAPSVPSAAAWPGTMDYARLTGTPPAYTDANARAAVGWATVGPTVPATAPWPGRVPYASIDGLPAPQWAALAPSVNPSTTWPGRTEASRIDNLSWDSLSSTVLTSTSWPGSVEYAHVLHAPAPYTDDDAKKVVTWSNLSPSITATDVFPGKIPWAQVTGAPTPAWTDIAPSVTQATAWPGNVPFTQVVLNGTTVWPGRVDWTHVDNKPAISTPTWTDIAPTVGAATNWPGKVAIANGGTGLTAGPTTSKQFLRSNGSGAWVAGQIDIGDLPDLTVGYVALTGAQTVGGVKTFSDGIVFSPTGAMLDNDQGGSLELGSGGAKNTGGAIPYIDFHYGSGRAEDYNFRVVNDGDRQLSLQGDYVRVGQAGVSGTSGIGTALVFSGNPGGDGDDPIWMARYFASQSTSELRVVVGDDPTNSGGVDYFTIGTSSTWYTDRTATYTKRFSVSSLGNVRAAGSFTANTSPDLAETINAAKDVEAGDVVCADHDRPEFAVRCDEDHRSVLGVISDGTSGFIINAHASALQDPLTGKPLVLAGRVPVKVSLANGPVRIGDWLAPSEEPGVAVKAVGPGPVVGMALEAFSGSPAHVGEVMVFVQAGEHVGSDDVEALRVENASLRRENADIRNRLERLESLVGKLAKKR